MMISTIHFTFFFVECEGGKACFRKHVIGFFCLWIGDDELLGLLMRTDDSWNNKSSIKIIIHGIFGWIFLNI